MIWFHTVALPLATLVAVLIGVKSKVALWKHAALVAGSGLMLAGLWLDPSWSTPLLVAGGILFFLGVPRRAWNGTPG